MGGGKGTFLVIWGLEECGRPPRWANKGAACDSGRELFREHTGARGRRVWQARCAVARSRRARAPCEECLLALWCGVSHQRIRTLT